MRINVFTEESNKILLSANNDRRMQLTNSLKTYEHETNKQKTHEKEAIKCVNIMKQYKK